MSNPAIVTIGEVVSDLLDSYNSKDLIHPVVNTLPFDLNKVINAAIKEHGEQVADDRGGHDELHASEMAYYCEYRRTQDLLCLSKGIRKKPIAVPAATQRKFDRGHAIHDLLHKWLSYTREFYGDWKCQACGHVFKFTRNPDVCLCGSKNLVYKELSFTATLPGVTGVITGSTDGAFRHKGAMYLLEIKSKDAETIKKVNSVDRAHYIQIQIYMHFFNIPQTIVAYVDENGSIAEGGMLVTYSPKTMEWVLEKLVKAERLHIAGRHEEAGKVCTSPTSMLAKNCIHVDSCFGTTAKRAKTLKRRE